MQSFIKPEKKKKLCQNINTESMWTWKGTQLIAIWHHIDVIKQD